MRTAPLRLGVAGLLLALGTPAVAQSAFQARSEVVPPTVRMGEPTRYRGRLIVPSTLTVFRWLPPEADDAFTWSALAPRRGRAKATGGLDTVEVEATLQVFRLGEIAIPGLRFQVQDAGRTRIDRLPLVRLQVISVLTPADSNATLRPLRGPIAAPWWERVPWTLVLLGLLALGAGVALYRWWKKRQRRPAPVVAPVYDPAAEALQSLAALRGLNLPAHGRYAEHALHLTRIARRFLEETAHTPRPGDTTPELLGHLEGARLFPADLERLAALLRAWDRVKFARASSSADEARNGEQVVEELVRRWTALEPATKVA